MFDIPISFNVTKSFLSFKINKFYPARFIENMDKSV